MSTENRLVDADVLGAAIAGSVKLDAFLEPEMRDQSEAEFDCAKDRFFDKLRSRPTEIQHAYRSHLYRYMTMVVEDFDRSLEG